MLSALFIRQPEHFNWKGRGPTALGRRCSLAVILVLQDALGVCCQHLRRRLAETRSWLQPLNRPPSLGLSLVSKGVEGGKAVVRDHSPIEVVGERVHQHVPSIPASAPVRDVGEHVAGHHLAQAVGVVAQTFPPSSTLNMNPRATLLPE